MTHQQIAIETFGAASTLRLRDQPARPPGPGEVAIDVKYSGVNFADIQMRLGFYPDAPKRPFVPGYEVSGHVAAVGAGVTGFRAGDAVVAGTYFGGYASQVTIDAAQVFPLPRHLDLESGAALPVNYFTARLALHEMARVRAGDKVLIECATGGVGVLAIQMARALGAEVTGLTTSAHKKPFIEGLGARAFTVEEFKADPALTGYDFILNASGGAEIKPQRARLAITGRMVCIGISSGLKDGKRSFWRIGLAALRTPRISVLKLFDQNSGIYALNALRVLQDPTWVPRLTQSLGEVAELDLRPHVGKVFAASEAAAAHELLQTKGATGKVLLAWS
ncbi:MAG: zinc-binding dehydrogenase [Deltaproteobacteria bacterium]|nr:zinc-binding dehydrogenase [Deltaproteobacteria bacterium]